LDIIDHWAPSNYARAAFGLTRSYLLSRFPNCLINRHFSAKSRILCVIFARPYI